MGVAWNFQGIFENRPLEMHYFYPLPSEPFEDDIPRKLIFTPCLEFPSEKTCPSLLEFPSAPPPVKFPYEINKRIKAQHLDFGMIKSVFLEVINMNIKFRNIETFPCVYQLYVGDS